MKHGMSLIHFSGGIESARLPASYTLRAKFLERQNFLHLKAKLFNKLIDASNLKMLLVAVEKTL